MLLKFDSQADSTGVKCGLTFCAICFKMSFPVMFIYKACNETQREHMAMWVLEE